MNETTFRPGDRVRIYGTSWGGRACFGHTGTIESGTGRDGYDFNVRVDGQAGSAMFQSSALTKVQDEPAKSAAEIDAEVSELPLANRQAAQYAHDLLGDSADLDTLIGVAEFVMDRRTLGTETTGTVSIGAVNIHVPATSAAPEDKLTITDEDGDRVEFAAREWDNPKGVNVTVYEDGDRATAYLTKDDLARVVAFLDGHRRTSTASA